MRLEKISLINIRHHPTRIILLAAGLLIAVATVVALYAITDVMYRDMQKKLDLYGSNMVITPKSSNLNVTYNGVYFGGATQAARYLHDNDIAGLKTIKNKANLAVIAPKLINAAVVRGRTTLVMGVIFKREWRIKKWWRLAAGRRPRGSRQVLLGAKAADKLRLKPGDVINIKGEKLKAVAVLRPTGSAEDDFIYVGLGRARRLFKQPHLLSLIEVATWCYNCPIEQIVGQASEKLTNAKVAAVWQAAKRRNRLLRRVNIFSLLLSVVMAATAVLIVFTNMLSAVRGRRREIGIFRAVGYRRRHIIEIIVFETVMISFLSGLAAYVIGTSAAKLIVPSLGVNMAVAWDPRVAYLAVLGTMLLALAASIYPILTAANMSPAAALNDV